MGASLWLASRLFVVGIALLSRSSAPNRSLASHGIQRLLFAWDSGYFLTIATSGYFSGPERAKLPAFFPGYPALAGLLSRALFFVNDPVGWALLLVSAGAGLVSAIMLWRLAEESGGRQPAFSSVLMFVFGPYAIFLHASYSEPLFLAFAISAWYFATRESWWSSGACAAGASFVRANGLFLVPALIIMYAASRRRAGKPLFSWASLGPLLGLLGPVTYFAWLWVGTGAVNSWGRAEMVGWGRHLTWPWVSLRNTAWTMLHRYSADAHVQFALDLVFGAGALVVAGFLAVRRWWPALTYVALTLAALMTSTTWMSLARNTLTLFPIPMALGRLYQAGVWGRRSFTTILVLSMMLLAFNTHQFTLGAWAD